MPGSEPSMAVQRKHSDIPPSQGPLSTRTIANQKKKNGSERTGDNSRHIKPNPQAKKSACSVNKAAQICNTASPRAVVHGPNIDERLRAARERREEHQKLLASREQSRLEREQRARYYYEQQLQERMKKLQDQRYKEERRRTAVEEKRKQRLKEEKERYESAVRRTVEKSQRAQNNLGQNSRGRKRTKNDPRRLPLTSWEKNLVSRLLTPTCAYLARSKSAACQSGEEVSFHSMNSTITTITTNTTPPKPKPQRQSGSVHPRPSASPSPNNRQQKSVNLAQIKNSKATQQDANKKNSNTRSLAVTITTITTNTTPPKPQRQSGSVHPRPSASPIQQRSVNLAQIKNSKAKQQDVNKKNSNTRSPAVKTNVKPAKVTQSRTTSPSPERTPRRSISRHSTPLQIELPSVPEEDVTICRSALSPGNSRPVRTSDEGQQEIMKDENPPESPCSDLPDKETVAVTMTAEHRGSPKTSPDPPPQPPEVICRPSAGTTDREEASRLLAEKRREARLQREREEQERLEKEEAERRSREELERRRAEERARQQAEAQRLIEEKMRREEEEQRKAEEERAQAMREAALLQKQREEEQAKEMEKAEQIKQEREVLAQKEEAARQQRKKRLEEIMRRTRKTDSPDTQKSAPVRILPNEARPKENTEPVHNGTIGDSVKLPVGTKTSQLGLKNEEDMVPVVAFKERRSLRTLTGLEEIQTHQRAEVI